MLTNQTHIIIWSFQFLTTIHTLQRPLVIYLSLLNYILELCFASNIDYFVYVCRPQHIALIYVCGYKRLFYLCTTCLLLLFCLECPTLLVPVGNNVRCARLHAHRLSGKKRKEKENGSGSVQCRATMLIHLGITIFAYIWSTMPHTSCTSR